MKNSIQFIIIGVVILLCGLLFAIRSYEFTKNTIPAQGKITSYIDLIDECFLIVTFVDTTGNTIQFVNRNREIHHKLTQKSSYPVTPFGTAYDGCFFQTFLTGKDGIVPVLYDAQKPEHAVIDDYFSRYVVSSSLFIIGLLCVISGFQIRRKNIV